MKLKCALLTAMLPFFSACGKTVIQLNHTLPTRPPYSKPTLDCKAAEMGVFGLVNKEAGFKDTSVIALGSGGCAVVITVDNPSNVVHMLGNVRNTSKSYTYYHSDSAKTFINVWVDEAPVVFKDANGKVLDTSPADEDCNSARDALKTLFDNVIFTTVVDRQGTPGPRRCYVDAVFTGDQHTGNFEHFMSWSNPTSSKKEPFHYYVTRGSLTKVVYIHAIDPIQN